MNRFTSRKFLLTVWFTMASTAGLFLGKIDAGSWIALVTLITGIYHTANVVQKKVTTTTTSVGQ